MKELFDEYMEDVSGGALVIDEERHEYWLVRRDGSVIAPVPMEKQLVRSKPPAQIVLGPPSSMSK